MAEQSTLPQDRFAADLRGFGPLGILAFLIVAAGLIVGAPVTAALVLIWLWLSKTPLREIGYVRPRSWIGGLVIGAAFGVALKFAMKAVVMPLLGAPPVNSTYHYLAGDPSAALGFFAYLIVGAGWGEETFFRDYLFERLGKLIGSSLPARFAIVLITAAIFSSLHYDQGWPGIEQAAMTGLIFGTIFAVSGRLWFLMCAHAAFDLTALAMIYYNLETRIAHLVFP